jgi:hypothetical protein
MTKAYEMKTDLKMIRVNAEAIANGQLRLITEMKYDDATDRRGKRLLSP